MARITALVPVRRGQILGRNLSGAEARSHRAVDRALVAVIAAYLIFKPRRSPEEITRIVADAQKLAAVTPPAVAEFPADPDLRKAMALVQSARASYSPSVGLSAGKTRSGSIVNGASQTGSSIVTNGWTASITGLLTVGDVFTKGLEAIQIAADESAPQYSPANSTVLPAGMEIVEVLSLNVVRLPSASV